MKLLSRALVSVAVTAGLLSFAGSAAHADWIACPGTENTVTTCVDADAGDPTTTQDTYVVDDCVNITRPDCEVPVHQEIPILMPGFEPAPSATVYVEVGGSPYFGPTTVGGGTV
jgi:hypothetical protein